MKHIEMADEEDKQAFAKEAASFFSTHPNHSSYTRSDIVAGCWFAIRWGIDSSSVVVFKLADDVDPVIYGQLVRQVGSQ